MDITYYVLAMYAIRYPYDDSYEKQTLFSFVHIKEFLGTTFSIGNIQVDWVRRKLNVAEITFNGERTEFHIMNIKITYYYIFF